MLVEDFALRTYAKIEKIEFCMQNLAVGLSPTLDNIAISCGIESVEGVSQYIHTYIEREEGIHMHVYIYIYIYMYIHTHV